MKRGILRTVEGGRLLFWCPGCACAHSIRIGEGEGPRWQVNGNYDRPTFAPSIFVNPPGPYFNPGSPVCHSFVRDGQIQFLGDSTHHLAGQTVPLPEFDAA